MSERWIDTGDATLRCLDVGDGPAVVFIHGWALDSEMWWPQIDALSDAFQVIAYDRRGFGASSGTPNLAMDALDLIRILDHVGVERVSLVGMSQGARVAAHFATQNAERVDRLVLDGPPALFGRDDGSAEEIPLAEYRTLFRELGIDAVRQAWREHPFAQLRTDDPKAHTTLHGIVGRYSGADLLAPQSELPPLDPAAFRLPVLIVNGMHDSAARLSSGAALERPLSNSRRVLVPDAGHLPCLDNPAFYNESLRAFLRQEQALPCSKRVAPEPNLQHKENRS